MITLFSTGVPLQVKRAERCMHCYGDTSCFIQVGLIAWFVTDIRPVKYQGGTVALCKYCREHSGHAHKASRLSKELIIECPCTGSGVNYKFSQEGHSVTLLRGALFENRQETIFYCGKCRKQFDSCPTTHIREIRS